MIRKSSDTTINNPSKMILLFHEYMKSLKINISLGEIEQMSKWNFKNIVKDRVLNSAFEYLLEQKDTQSKAKSLKYHNLKMKDYLVLGLCNTRVSTLIFIARTETVNIKTHKRWKYDNLLCVACKRNEEDEKKY